LQEFLTSPTRATCLTNVILLDLNQTVSTLYESTTIGPSLPKGFRFSKAKINIGIPGDASVFRNGDGCLGIWAESRFLLLLKVPTLEQFHP